MKIIITAQPKFQLQLPRAVVLLLMDCSKYHYDAACRQAGARGGFLYGWNNIMTPFEGCDPEAEGVAVSGTFSELDLTLKLCEMQHHRSPADRRLLWDYAGLVSRALSRANQITWPSEDVL